DAGAFEQLYLRNKDGLYRFMLRQCGSENITDELFQDVWLKLINARQRYHVNARFRTYLYQIARNRIIDHYRSTSRNTLDNSGADVVEDLTERKQLQPEQQAETGEQLDAVLAAIDGLPDEQREVFLLKEEAGMSLEEIAGVTGVNAETAKSRLRYAIRKIRNVLDKADD
ncbi:MAG: sigma-70 family RNA polymerase sigma factor, partial [Thiotrichales bacterium]|nr:sigma-70 family RNA polymerase sigma factor [Thiotrichales bacterium]